MHHRRQALGLLIGALLLSACARRYPHGGGLVGQLESEIVALHGKVRLQEQALLACGDTQAPSSLFQQLVQVFPPSGEVRVDVQLGEVRLIAPWDHFIDEQGQVQLRARMTLDLLTSVLAAHPQHDLWLLAHASPGDDALGRGFVAARAAAAELTERFKLDPARVVVSAGVPAEAPHLEVLLRPRGEPVRADR
jgi:hypothetical protein